MWLLILGLILFLGIHSVRFFAEDWRKQRVLHWGLTSWKLLFSLVSLVGLVLIIWGYVQARLEPQWLWISPVWTRHLAALLTIPAFILLVATYVPATHIKARVGHPMLLGVKFWAIAHLIANGSIADVILFGSFLVWAVIGFVICRRRDRAAGRTYPAKSGMRDLIAIVVGLCLWVLFAFGLHQMLIGVAPLGR